MKELLSLLAALFAVAVVIYLSYLFSKYISMGSSKLTQAKHMTIIDRLMVGQDRFILIVRVQDSVFLVSVTSQAIQILKELKSDDFGDENTAVKKDFFEESFKSILQKIKAKK